MLYSIEGVEDMRNGSDGVDQLLITWEGYTRQTWESVNTLPNMSAEIAELRGRQLAKAQKQLDQVLAWEVKLKAFTVRCNTVKPQAQAIVERAQMRKAIADGVREDHHAPA